MPDPNVVEQPVQTPQPGGEKPAGSTQQPAVTAQPVVKQEPAPAQKSGVDDKQRGLLADLQKERQTRQRLEQQLATHQAELDARQRRIQALAGVNPQSEEEAELEAVRERVKKLFPVLGRLTDEKLEKLLSLDERSGGLEEAAQHHWSRHATTMLDSLQKAVAEEIGSDLTDRQKKALGRAYVAEAESDPEFLKRHEAGDTKLIEEFAKGWIEDWFEPARKQVVTTEVNRQRRVPSGRDRNVSTTPPKKVDFKDPKAVEDAMVESFKSHGGRFEN
jgi:hypothetical protein